MKQCLKNYDLFRSENGGVTLVQEEGGGPPLIVSHLIKIKNRSPKAVFCSPKLPSTDWCPTEQKGGEVRKSKDGMMAWGSHKERWTYQREEIVS